MKTALILYWSHTGNTEKVAGSIRAGLEAAGVAVDSRTVKDAGGLDVFAYDLVCLGFPSHNWHPPRPMDDYLQALLARHRAAGHVLPGAPTRAGRQVLVFCTYSGPHTGIREAIPAVKYAAQFFEHLGFAVLDEWYVLAEFHGDEEMSTQGRMGDIKGLPSERDLALLESRAQLLARRLGAGARATSGEEASAAADVASPADDVAPAAGGDSPHYRAKHPDGTSCDPALARALSGITKEGRFTCAAACRLAERLGVDPAELGRTADLLELRIMRCQLGLFGHEPEKRIVRPADEVTEDLGRRLQAAVVDGSISCAALWEIADAMGLERMAVSAACERLKLKISPCRLGAF